MIKNINQVKGVLCGVVTMLILSACTTAKLNNADEAKRAEAQFSEKYGALTLIFDKDGNWESIKSAATFKIVGKGYSAISDASTIAAMRAKQNILEFMSNELRSEKTFNSLTKAYSEQLADGDEKSGREGSDVASRLQIQISDNSSAILKGVMLIGQEISSDSVAVTLEVNRSSLRASKELRRAMGAGF